MNKPNVTKMIDATKATLVKRSPEILMGMGIAGWFTTAVLVGKETPKALRLIEDAEYEKGEPLTAPEKVKAAWKPYVPAVITGALSTACLIGSSSVSLRRNAALATAYQIASTTLTEYKEQVVETIGEKKEKTIREKVAQKKVETHPEVTKEVIITGSGDVLFVEPVSMRSFTSDIETVRKAINDLNYRMTVGMEEYISLSELYDEIGLPRTAISDDIGWNIGKDGQIEYQFHACTTAEGKPALMLDYQVAPRRGYTELM